MDAVPFTSPRPDVPFVIVRAETAGGPAAVLLDTGSGAPFTVLVSPGLARRSGAELGPEPSAGATAVGGDAVAFRPATLASFQLGPVRLSNVRVGVSPALDSVSAQIGAPVDAIVGHHFLKDGVLSIDYRRKLVDFAAPRGSKRSATPFVFAPRRPLPLVRVHVNGKGPYLFALDSAASASLLSPATAAAAGVRADTTVTLGGGGGAVAGGARLGTAEIAFGAFRREGARVAVADVLGPVGAAVGASVDGVLGADLFAGARLTIDYPGARLWVNRSR